MKTTWMTTMMLVSGAVAYGQSAGAAAERKVTVCVEGRDASQTPGATLMAERTASKIFAGIGVTIEWRIGFNKCAERSLRVSLTFDTPTDLKPEALAYALPYEGTHIRVFYDRIVRGQRYAGLVSPVLAHVLVHEITHILQGMSRHSDRGIMKARWSPEELLHMSWKPMEFTEHDVILIHAGLARRASNAAAVGNADSREAAVAIEASR